jgi:hypothetical protein
MATVHDTPGRALPTESRPSRASTRDVWPSVAICAMWLAVLLDALFGPDMVFNNTDGSTVIPSAVVVALFAYLGTRALAKHGFTPPPNTDATG